MDTIDTSNEETDIIVVDLRDNDVLKFILCLEIEAASHVDKWDRFAAQSEESVDIRVCLRHCRDRCTRNDLTHFSDVNAVVYLPDAELDNLKFIRSCLKQDSFSLFGNRLCNLSLSPMPVNIVCYALYSLFGKKILPVFIKN